jgi:cell division protein FtsB
MLALEHAVSDHPLVSLSHIQHGVTVEFARYEAAIEKKDAEIKELKDTKELYEAEISRLKVLYHQALTRA